MKLLSIEYIPGVEFEPLGIVKGTVVQTKNVGRDFMAGMKTLVGGEIRKCSMRQDRLPRSVWLMRQKRWMPMQ